MGTDSRRILMTAQYKDKIEVVIADRERITKALAEGVKEALKQHKLAGNSVVVMREGNMVWLRPEEITV
jgi:hypothetical protein